MLSSLGVRQCCASGRQFEAVSGGFQRSDERSGAVHKTSQNPC
jgi:hypothetical protein